MGQGGGAGYGKGNLPFLRLFFMGDTLGDSLLPQLPSFSPNHSYPSASHR